MEKENLLFLDIKGSTTLIAQIGPKRFADEMKMIHQKIKWALKSFGFKLLSFGGDSFVIKFSKDKNFHNLIKQIDSDISNSSKNLRENYRDLLKDVKLEKKLFKKRYTLNSFDEDEIEKLDIDPYQQEFVGYPISICSKVDKYFSVNEIALSQEFVYLNNLYGFTKYAKQKISVGFKKTVFYIFDKHKYQKILKNRASKEEPGMWLRPHL